MKARAPKISARFFVSSRGGCGRLASAANASLPEGGMTGKPAKREAISADNPRTIPGQPASKKNFGRPRFKRKAGLRLLCAAAPIIFRTSDGQTNFKRLPPRTAGRTHARRNRAQQNKTRMQARPKKTPREISTGGKRAMRIRKLSRNFASAKPCKKRRTAHSSRTQRQTRKVKYASKERFKNAPAKMSAPDFQTKKAPQNKESLRTKPRIKKRRTNVPAKKILLFFGLRFRRLRHSLRFAAGL